MFTHCVSMNISLLKYSWTICAVVNVNSWARSLTVRVWTVMDWLLSCGTSVNIFNINIFNTNIFNQHCEEQFLWPRLIRLCIGKLAFRPFDWFQESYRIRRLGRLNVFDLSVTMALKKFMIIFVVCPQICVFVFLCNHQTVDCIGTLHIERVVGWR